MNNTKIDSLKMAISLRPTEELSEIIKLSKQIEEYLREDIKSDHTVTSNICEMMSKYSFISHPIIGVIPLELYPHQILMINSIENSKRLIMTCARQIGKSTILALWAFWYCFLNPDKSILFITSSFNQRKDILNKINPTIDRLPDFLKKEIKENHTNIISFKNNSRIHFSNWTENLGLRLSITDIIIDEAAYLPFKNEDKIFSNIEVFLSLGARIILASTPNINEGLFFKFWQDTRWNKLLLPYHVMPNYNNIWKLKQEELMNEETFNREYNCQFKI